MGMSAECVLSLGPHGFHRIAFTHWGSADNPRVLICVHGLTRTGRDFDALAKACEEDYQVACPDLPGRGESQWLTVATDYQTITYLNDMAALIARLGATEVDWVGTSLGGQLGMILAAQPGTPIRRLVLNDIGAFVPREGLQRIADYVGSDPEFEDEAGLEAYLREVHAPFGQLTDEQWAHLTRHSARHDPNTGRMRLHYDPGLAAPFKEGFGDDLSFWPLWDAVQCPVLILRGAESDILPREIAEEMTTRVPSAELVQFDGMGHAPMLMDPDQIAAVRNWLSE